MSVRAATSSIERLLARRFTIPDLSLLPKFHNYTVIANAPSSLNLKDKYRSFVFNIIFVGKLNYESTLYRAIDAARFALRNPRVGLIVLGDGPARTEFERRAKILGIEQQVVFEKRETDIIPYLKSGNLLLVTDTDGDSDDTILMGAAAGIPLIMSRTARREDIFEHGVSAYLCEETDTQAFADRINDLLNDLGLRKVFTGNASAMVERRFHQSIGDYQESYRTSIEHALFVESDEEMAKSTSEEHQG
jgi:glycogen(starch) synthase